MNQNTILNIGGFYILIRFSETEIPTLKALMIRFINSRYEGFIFLKKPPRIDYLIKFKDDQTLQVLIVPTGKRLYVNLYERTKSKELITYYHVSLSHFDLILTHVLQDLLAENNGFLFHTSAALINGNAYCFMGKSGAGKSTIVSLLSSYHIPLADDSGIIRKVGNSFIFYQMPLIDKNRTIKKSPEGYPVKRIYFLHKAKQNKIQKILNKGKLMHKISAQLYSKKEDIGKQIVLINEFTQKENFFYDIFFGQDEELLNRIVQDPKLPLSKLKTG